MLLDVAYVDPFQRVHEHLVKGWSNIAHQGHEKEGHLEHVLLNEVESPENGVIPCCLVQAEEDRQNADQDLDSDNLFGRVSRTESGWTGLSASHRDSNGQANENAGKHSTGGLAIVGGGKETRILKGPVS